MAKKPATTNSSMNIKAHEETFHNFLNLTKISIIALAITVVALYCFVIAAQPWLGAFLLIIVMPAAVIFNVVAGMRE